MIETELESCIKDQFGMDPCEFMREKVEEDALYDYEVASILNASTSLIRRFRINCRIHKANGFSKRFERTYGKDEIDEFKKMIENPDNSLADVGKHFKFSREYARQAYKKIYGCSYGESYRSKRLKRRQKRFADKMRTPRGDAKLMKISKKMSSMGIPFRMLNAGRSPVILNNGYKLQLRMSSTPLKAGKNQYFRINVAKTDNHDFDFFICVCCMKQGDTHFIIPSDVMPKTSITLLPQATPEQSKYARFKESWHLLG